MTSPTKGLVERLEESAQFRNMPEPHLKAWGEEAFDSLIAIRELLDEMKDFIEYVDCGKQGRVTERCEIMLSKYQPEDK